MHKKNTQVKMKNLTKGDLVNIFWRNTLGLQLGWNYPRMQGLGYAYTVMPALKRLYKNKKDRYIKYPSYIIIISFSFVLLLFPYANIT